MTTPGVAPYRQLRRPLDDRIVAGVCSGIGRYFGIDPVLVRVGLAVLVAVSWGVAVLAYPVMWFLIPEEPGPAASAWRDPADPAWGRPWTPPADAAAYPPPTAPTAPTGPTASTAPTAPAASADPVNLADPTAPTDPTDPVDPALGGPAASPSASGSPRV